MVEVEKNMLIHKNGWNKRENNSPKSAATKKFNCCALEIEINRLISFYDKFCRR